MKMIRATNMIGTTNYEHDKNNDKHVKDHNDDGEDA